MPGRTSPARCRPSSCSPYPSPAGAGQVERAAVAAHILGAPITGHLDARLRKDAGHSYGLRAELTELVPGTGLLLAGGAVAAEATIGALGDIKDILTAPAPRRFRPRRARHRRRSGHPDDAAGIPNPGASRQQQPPTWPPAGCRQTSPTSCSTTSPS